MVRWVDVLALCSSKAMGVFTFYQANVQMLCCERSWGGGYFYDDFDRAGRCLQFFSYQQCLSVPCCVAVLSDMWRGSAEP